MRRRLILIPLVVQFCAVASSCKNQSSGTSSSESAPAAAGPEQVAADWKAFEQAPVGPADFNLVSFPSTDLDKNMTPGSGQQNIPEVVQGIWWMDGNPFAPGNVTTFAHMAWDLANRRVLVQEYGDGNYTFNDDESGRKSFNQSCLLNVNFEVTFTPDYKHAQLIQVVRIPLLSLAVKIDKHFIDYQMDLVGDGDWLRKSKLVGKSVTDYHLRRIVDANGNRVEPAYTNFLKAAPPKSLIPHLIPKAH